MSVERRENREQARDPKYVPAKDTALFRGALLEIAKKDAEIVRLQGLLRDAGIPDDEIHETVPVGL